MRAPANVRAPAKLNATRSLARLAAVAAVSALVGCSQGDSADPSPAQANVTRGASAVADVLQTSLRLGQKDTRIADALAEREANRGWTSGGRGYVAGAATKDPHGFELAAEIGDRANGDLRIGVHGFEALAVHLHLEGARDVAGTLAGGRVVYAGALGPAVDRIVTSAPSAVEELLLLHDASAPGSYAWHVDLPPSIARVVPDERGGLSFRTAAGRDALHLAPPYAVDAEGTTRGAVASWDAKAGRLSVHLDTAGLAFPLLLDPVFESVLWELTSPPTDRDGGKMVYDPIHQVTMLFGGVINTTFVDVNDTWLWNGTRWSPWYPTTSPPARSNHAMAYDAARQRTVLFGGESDSATAAVQLSDTWTWDGVTWSEATPLTIPPARHDAMMAYDAVRRVTVMYGGEIEVNNTLTPAHDTWTWDGSDWTEVTGAVYPPDRYSAVMEFDAARGKTVLFGGESASLDALADTWLWDGTTWSQATPAASPSARDEANFFYDSTRQTLVVYGGFGNTSPPTDTWSWNGTTWTQLTTTGTPLGYTRSLGAYDAARSRGVMLMDEFFQTAPIQQTWTFDGSTWAAASSLAAPSARIGAVFGNDTAHGTAVLFGGEGNMGDLGDTWVYDGERWSQKSPATSPPARGYGAGTYDPVHGNVVIFGGRTLSPSSTLGDTWTWNGTTWTQMHPAKSPPARLSMSMIYDPDIQKVVLYGGFTGVTTDYGDTWTWDGANWTQLSPATTPGTRDAYAAAYDPAHHQIVIFSGSPGLPDTWTFDGATWTQHTTAHAPHYRNFAAMSFEAVEQRVVLFGGYENGTNFADTWSWDGTDWTQLTVSTQSPAARWGVWFGTTPGGNGLTLFSGEGTGLFDDTWRFTTAGGGCTTGAQCDSGYCVDGVCCGSAACAACQTCAGSAPGLCDHVVGTIDPDSCTGDMTCSQNGTCLPTNGHSCTRASECASGSCVDGVCCDTACNGTCQACSAATKTSGPDGVCGTAQGGTDPHDTCVDPTATGDCGLDGKCDGNGACRLTPAGVSCGASECIDNLATGRVCNGLGLCTASAQGTACGMYLCSNAAAGCLTSCASDGDCTLGNYCGNGVCSARKAYGATCTASAECPAGAACADGVCCNTGCTGQCESCAEPGSEGSCVPVSGAPRKGRTPCDVTSDAGSSDEACAVATCNGVETDACKGYVGPTVACRAPSCSNGVATVAGACNGKGACPDIVTHNCTPYVCRGPACAATCASDADCDAAFRCDAASGKCVTKSEATCDGDHTLTAPDGTTTSCLAYRCNGSVCETTCDSIESCAQGFVCDGNHACVAAVATVGADAGCAVASASDAAGSGPSVPWETALVAAALGGRRRRRRQRGDARGAR